MLSLRIGENLKLGLVAFIALISIGFWSFSLIDKSLKMLEVATVLCLVVIVVYNSKIFVKKNIRFRNVSLLFILIPLLSAIGSTLFHQQPLTVGLQLNRLAFFWLLYLVLHVLDIPADKIRKLVIFIGCVWAGLTIIQQFTYPKALFFTRSDNDKNDIYRFGVYRFMLEGREYGTFVLLYFFYQFVYTKKAKTLFYVFLALLGTYYFGTRQIAVASVASMLLSVLFLKGFSKWVYIGLIFAAGATFIIVSKPELITNSIEMTNSQVENDDYIRYLSADFYLNDYWPHWTAKLLGNGKSHESTSYGQELEYLQHVLHFWRSDVGLIGTYNQYGLFYVLLVFWFYFKGITRRFADEKDKYLKLVFINSALLILLSERLTHSVAIPFYCMLLYLVDKAMDQKKNEKSTNDSQELRPVTQKPAPALS